jgi:transcriptional regulator with XRE-family HTH domain
MNRLSNKELVQELMRDPEFKKEYDALGPEFELIEKMLMARNEAGLTQAQVAKKMRTTTSVIGRLETSIIGGKTHSPSISTLDRYARALGCHLKIDFVPDRKGKVRAVKRKPLKTVQSKREDGKASA